MLTYLADYLLPGVFNAGTCSVSYNKYTFYAHTRKVAISEI